MTFFMIMPKSEMNPNMDVIPTGTPAIHNPSMAPKRQSMVESMETMVMPNFLNEKRMKKKMMTSDMPMPVAMGGRISASFTDEQISELDEYYALFFRTLFCPEALYKSETFRSLITAALYRIGTIFVSKIKAEGNRSANNRQMALFERFMQLLETHHATERNIAFYADRLFLTPKHVSKVILEVSGKTPTQWIDEYVVLEAKSLLKYSNLTIQEIADYLNFSTQSVFGKYFKHKTGLSPREYKAS